MSMAFFMSGSVIFSIAALNAASASSTSGTSNLSTSCAANGDVAKFRSCSVSSCHCSSGVRLFGWVRLNQSAYKIPCHAITSSPFSLQGFLYILPFTILYFTILYFAAFFLPKPGCKPLYVSVFSRKSRNDMVFSPETPANRSLWLLK